MAMNLDLDDVEDFYLVDFALDCFDEDITWFNPLSVFDDVGGVNYMKELAEMGMYPENPEYAPAEWKSPILAPKKGEKKEEEALQKMEIEQEKEIGKEMEIGQEMKIGGGINVVNEIAKMRKRKYPKLKRSERAWKIPTLLPKEKEEALQKIEIGQEKEIGKVEIGQEMKIGQEIEVGQKMEIGQGKKTDQGQHLCKICKTMLKSGASLRAHLVALHSIKAKNYFVDNTGAGGGVFTPGTNICKDCQKGFTMKKDFLAHRSLSAKIMCIFCTKDFSCGGAWAKHMKIHLENVQLFQCFLCTKTLSSRHNLRTHYATHLPNQKYVCPICYKDGNGYKAITYRTLKGITTHLKTHGADELSSA